MNAVLNEFLIRGENIHQRVFVKEYPGQYSLSNESLVRFIQYKMPHETQDADITFIGVQAYNPKLELNHIVL